MGAKQGPKETFKMSTLLVENAVAPVVTPVATSETERMIHAFAADLIGTRRSLQKSKQEELVRSFCNFIFDKAVEELEKNPFGLNTCVFVHEKDFDGYNQILCMILAEGSYTLSKKITELVKDLDIKKVKIDITTSMIGVIIDYA